MIPSPFSARSPAVHTWRPWSLRMPFFITFAALCAFLSIAIEAVMRGCSTDGCHIFGSISTKTLSHTTTFVYNLLPTALGVGLSLLWAVPHHDLMRLEPYFQMSTDGGASVQALFLQYPYTFLLCTPFVAGKQRHYSVLLSSCIYLLMTFVATPPISGIFDDTILGKQIGGDATRNILHPLDSRSHALSDFAYPAYSYSWLGRQLPPFTTQSYALLPVLDTAGIRSGNETWSAVTTLLEAELLCQPAGINFSTWDMSGISGNITSHNGSTGMQFCGYNSTQSACDIDTNFMTPWTALVGMKYNPESYYIGWARGADLALDMGPDLHRAAQEMLGVSCSPAFYWQQVNATFVAGSGGVLSVDRVGVRTLLKPPLIFLDVMRGGPSSFPIPPQFLDNIDTPVRLGFMPPQLPNTMAQMEWRLGSCPEKIAKFMVPPFWTCSGAVHISGMEQFTAFALYNQTWDTLPELLDSDTLVARYNNAFKLLFAFWVSIDMVDTDAVESVRVTRRVWGRGFAVNKTWARGAQGSLVAVAAMVVVLGMMVSRRSCELDGEPNSLGEGLRLLSVSEDLSSDMEGVEFYKPDDLRQIMDQRGKRYSLKQIVGKGPRVHVTKLPECMQLKTEVEDTRWTPREPANTRTFEAQESIDVPEAMQLLSPGSEKARPWIDTTLWQLKAVTGFGFVVT